MSHGLRFLVVGAGATGGYFGARLAQAGRDVTFLVRPERARQLRAGGLSIVSPTGDAKLEPRIVDAVELRPEYDAIILAVKAYALDGAIDDFAPAVGAGTMVLPFLNGMRHIDALVARFGERPILGGVCLVSTMLDVDGRIIQLSEMQELAYGERDGSNSTRIAALDAALQGAGFSAQSSPHIVPDMWGKWVGLAALGAVTCLLRGTIGDITAAGGSDIARAVLAECSAVATAAGFAPGAERAARLESMLTQPGSALASSMYRDLQHGRRVELDQILGDLLERARTFGVAAPLVTAAFTSLKIYDARMRGPLAAAGTTA